MATVFLLLNGVNLQAPSVDEGEAFVVAVAEGRLDLDKIAARITSWSS
jgi:death on curing protein